MPSRATLQVDITTDASNATRGLDQTTRAVENLGQEAKTAGDKIEHIGGKAGQTTTGLRDMADAVAMVGFPQLAAGMGVAATAFESIDGAATLYAAHSEHLAKVTGLVTKAMNFLKASILTNPIFIIAAIIIAIGLAFILAYKKCETFRKIVDAVFRAVKRVIQTVWNWIKSVFKALLGVLKKPFEAWLKVVKTIFNGFRQVVRVVFNAVKAVIRTVMSWIKTIFGKLVSILKVPFEKWLGIVKSVIGKVKDVITGLWDKIKSIFGGVYDAIKKPFQKAIDWIKSHFKLPSLPSWLPGVGKSAATASYAVPGPRSAATGPVPTAGTQVVVNFNGPVGDPHATARVLKRLFREDDARLGRRRVGPNGPPTTAAVGAQYV